RDTARCRAPCTMAPCPPTTSSSSAEACPASASRSTPPAPGGPCTSSSRTRGSAAAPNPGPPEGSGLSARRGGCLATGAPEGFWIELGAHTCYTSYGAFIELLEGLDLMGELQPRGKA